jgi:hypothetical protein
VRAALLLTAASLALAGCGGDEPASPAPPATAATTAAAGTTAAAAAEEIPGCAPLCLEPNLTRPGPVPAGKYASQYFFAGRLTADVAPGWEVTEDSTGELRFAGSDPDYGVLLWEDVYPVHQGERVEGVPQTEAGLLDWLRRSLDLDLTEPKPGAIGNVPATQVDVTISAEATNDDPGCPARLCVNPLRFPQWDGPWGMAGEAATRLWLADVRYGGVRHLFVAAVEGRSRADLAKKLPAAERLLRSVRVPVEPG